MTIEPIGFVRSSRTGLEDDDWGDVVATIELADGVPTESLTGLEEFSHAEVIFQFDRVAQSAIESGARHPRENRAWPKIGIPGARSRFRASMRSTARRCSTSSP